MLIGIRNAAAVLGVSEKTIRRWVADDKIPHTRAGNQYRFSRSELIAWATISGKHLMPEAACETETADEPLPRLTEALERGGIYYRVGGSNSGEVIRKIVSVMRISSAVDRDYLETALSTRETLASTGVGGGIAIPHPRHPLIKLDESLLSLAFLAHPVDWHAIDGMPVSMVFVLCCPTTRSHLHLLSRLSFAIRDSAWRDRLRKEPLREEILESLVAVEHTFREPIVAATA